MSSQEVGQIGARSIRPRGSSGFTPRANTVLFALLFFLCVVDGGAGAGEPPTGLTPPRSSGVLAAADTKEPTCSSSPRRSTLEHVQGDSPIIADRAQQLGGAGWRQKLGQSPAERFSQVGPPCRGATWSAELVLDLSSGQLSQRSVFPQVPRPFRQNRPTATWRADVQGDSPIFADGAQRFGGKNWGPGAPG